MLQLQPTAEREFEYPSYKGVVTILTRTEIPHSPETGLHAPGTYVIVTNFSHPDNSAMMVPLAAFPEPPQPDERWNLEIDTGGIVWNPNPMIVLSRVP